MDIWGLQELVCKYRGSLSSVSSSCGMRSPYQMLSARPPLLACLCSLASPVPMGPQPQGLLDKATETRAAAVTPKGLCFQNVDFGSNGLSDPSDRLNGPSLRSLQNFLCELIPAILPCWWLPARLPKTVNLSPCQLRAWHTAVAGSGPLILLTASTE